MLNKSEIMIKGSKEMLSTKKQITIELGSNEVTRNKKVLTNPISQEYTENDKISMMIARVIEDEFPQIKNNSLLYDLVLYSITEKMKTVQSVENVLSYIKGTEAKEVRDVTITNGEVLIKCLT